MPENNLSIKFNEFLSALQNDESTQKGRYGNYTAFNDGSGGVYFIMEEPTLRGSNGGKKWTITHTPLIEGNESSDRIVRDTYSLPYFCIDMEGYRDMKMPDALRKEIFGTE